MIKERMREIVEGACLEYFEGKSVLGVAGLREHIMKKLAEQNFGPRRFEDDFILTSSREDDGRCTVHLIAKSEQGVDFISRFQRELGEVQAINIEVKI